MMTRTTHASLLAASLFALSGLAAALELPRHGALMNEVRAKFGAPAVDLGAVGSPAITRWVYDGFTVYFEGSHVIEAVQTQRLGTAAPAPAPAAAPAPQPSVIKVPAPAPAAPPPAPMAAPAFAPAPMPAPAEPDVEDMSVVEEEAVVEDTQPLAAPEPTGESEPAPASSSSGFRFDPATGRLIIDDGSEQEPAAPAAETPVEGTPRTGAAPQGQAMDETLEFDPETGTFKPVSR